MAKSKLSPAAAIQADRVVAQAKHLFKVIEAGRIAFYTSDQFANATVGPLSWSIRGNGRQPTLGDWTASCTDQNKDSDRLYRNIALRDEFEDTDEELWQFKGLPKAARGAAKPLRACSVGYRAGLASFLPQDWADTKAAKIVAAQLVDALPNTTDDSIRSAVAPAMCKYPSHRMVNGQVPSNLVRPGYVGLTEDGGVVGRPGPRRQLGGSGRVHLRPGRASWPNVLGVYGPGTRLLGSADLGDLGQGEHSDVNSMSPTSDGLEVRWKSYEGAGFDVEAWRGRLVLLGGTVRLVDVQRN